jgi:flagellin FlaB
MRRDNIRMNEQESSGSIGIGAMIVFIALILVAAVASAVIIQTGEKLQQNAQQTGDDTREEIGGKVSIITMWVADQTDCDGDDGGDDAGADFADKCITLVYELAAGSEPVEESNVVWTIICANDAGDEMTTIWGDFSTADSTIESSGSDTVNVDNTPSVTTTLLPGEVYMIDLKVETDDTDGDGVGSEGPTSAECAPVIGEEHTLIISVEGGGTTYETMSYNSITEGDTIV